MAEKSSFSATTSVQPSVLTKFGAKHVSYAHTVCAYSAFLLALAVGCYTHYYKIVRNEHFGYPIEWFPSVSATTGDRYPARAIFQILIALTSGPRFALVVLWYLYTTRSSYSSSRGFGKFLLIVGILRTVSCGGWVYITSTDDHLTHDITMITYLVCTLPWQLGVIYTSARNNPQALKWRRILTAAFFTTLPPMIYYFLQHKVQKVPGAYTTYAFFEWSLILYDVAFDAVTALDFQTFELAVVDVSGGHAGAVPVTKEGSSKIGSPEDSISPSFLRSLVNLRGYVSEVYLAFVFWSMLTSLALLIWYFPLWHMGISGYEAFLLITISPMVLGIRPLRRVMAKYRGVFHILSLVGLASYLQQDPALRLTMTACGLGLSVTTWMATWFEARAHVGSLERSILIWGVGLLMHNVVKMAWWTENPIWPIMHAANGGWNEIGIVLAFVASIEVIIRDVTSPTAPEHDLSESTSSSPISPGANGSGNSSWLMAASGFGAVLFALHSMYTDSSAIMRYTVDGYPNYGPEPIPWGVATITALTGGLLVSSSRRLTTSPAYYVVGCLACAAFYCFSAWKAYYAGLVLGFYLMSVMPALARAITTHPPFKTLFTAFMVYNLLCLAHVWVVAYAFVPAGVYLRERIHWVLGAVMFLIGCGVVNARKQATWDVQFKKMVQLHIVKSARSLTRVASLFVVVASVLVAANRSFSAVTPAPYHPAEKSFNAAIWTIHFALDDDMWASEMRMRDVIQELELDVVGLLESDTMRIIMGNRDWAQFLAEDLGYYVDYGPSTMKHTWGCLMLSKFPILKSEHHLLPSPVGELACAIHATLDVYGQPVDFIVSHNGQEEDPEDRRLQTTELARVMRTSPNPFVFLGYVVTKPKQPLYYTLFDDGDMNDIDPTDWDRWCQYIGYRGLRRVGYARVSHGKITDTEIQTGKFQVVETPRDYWKASYDRVDESQVPAGLRYPTMFRGRGVRGHRYHVFNEPRYFIH
ncbi:Frag1/DRAM/Sfk1 family-domain-containing protein [Zychaea mexicana]|uniref:Frag1/DRAM/Sfk1 family-domain-containing protein n=1 Tax=Zychaea mexicana TaxID=64656 RepID=UPI0022FED0D1|nr:Frag1/DRAM/Sfk1 family-domain-containing protein [Zychaea mexicana]KAI9493497.1 Frag1/DRAM/Sfk1 family-domain-containing protein [Zychaea mexicana]